MTADLLATLRAASSPLLDAARERDGADPLAALRARFALPDGVYLDGNSLGAMPATATAAMQAAMTRGWADGLIRSWNAEGWHMLPVTVGDRLAALMGAAPSEVLVCDSTSVNLYKTFCAAMAMRPGRRGVISERNNFPTDVHILQGAIRGRFPEARLDLAEDDDASVLGLLSADTAVVCLSHVNYRTGRLRDMTAVTKAAHEAGALVIWDLAHSLGALPVDLGAARADFAVGCTYKYLNAGPGGPAWLYVAARHLEAAATPLTGWQGHAAPFAFDIDFSPAETIEKFRCGTPPVLSYIPLMESLSVFEATTIEAIRDKSLALTAFFIELADERLARHGLTVITPRDGSQRGSQVALTHDDGWPIMQALIASGVIGDFRAPDILRFGFTPLYVSFEDAALAVLALERIMETGLWREPRFAEKKLVT
ncbi:MAG: kynureninase [Rhizobiaceae bacterium]|nr:kynureninase [Rhizobiaceae bacterium]MCV0406530.1 kynureninase [Rhizobiaceae bacterium]